MWGLSLLVGCAERALVAPGTGLPAAPMEIPAPVAAPPARVKVTGRVLDEAGAPVGSVMVQSGADVTFTDADGRYEIALTVAPGERVTLVAEALYTGPCGDPGNCGIAISSDFVADLADLGVLAAVGEGGEEVRTLQHDFRLLRSRTVTVVPRMPGEGWPFLVVSCLDPQRPERKLVCPSAGADPAPCPCPPGDVVLEVFRAELRVPVAADASRVEVDLRGHGGLTGRLVRDGNPAFGHLALAEDVDGPLDGFPVIGDFQFGPIPARPVHLVFVARDDRRVDLGVHEPGSPTKALGDIEVPAWDPSRE
jgi:hypothetical protein